MIKNTLAVCMLFLLHTLNAQTNTLLPSQLVAQAEAFEPVSIFNVSTDRNVDLPDELVAYDILDIDKQATGKLLENAGSAISLPIPMLGRKPLNLQLVQVDIAAADNYVTLEPSGEKVKVKGGKHYRGIVDGKPTSIAAISVYDDQVMGLISDTKLGNLVLGKLETSDKHILYRDDQLSHLYELGCETPDSDVQYTDEELNTPNSRALTDCVKLYFEVDYDIYQSKGSSVSQTTDYITGLFNQVAIMYANENINVTMQPLVIWTQSSPYSGSSSSTLLNQFRSYRTSFDGDLGMLLSYQASGGIAYVNTLCNNSFKYSFSSIDASYNNVPTYSWSVMVVTHEFGHLFGSNHTHACSWNGNNTAIDGCYTTEGSCPQPGIPSGGGTVMSYCHLTSVGINLNLGFGPQPGNVIRNRVSNASCTDACPGGGGGGGGGGNTCTDNEATLTILTDNYPGETTWTVTDNGGNVLYSGGPYSSANTTYTVDMCLPDDCFNFNISDSYGDGICCAYGQGSYSVSAAGNVLISGGQFGSSETQSFCVGGGTAPSCTDGVQNGNETGVDCGGPDCPACPSCNDGVQNGNETGVDCGGPDCAACPTCTDGVQNGNETGIDCGGPDCAPCNTGGGGDQEIFAHYFESGWDGWQDGGSDCYRYSGSRSFEGSYSIRIRDNSGTSSAMTSPVVDLSSFTGAELTFYFYPNSMENGEDFWVRYYDGSSWTTIATFASGSSFNNNTFYTTTVPIPGNIYNMASNARIRIQCDASSNADRVYIDQVTLTGLGSGNLISNEVSITALGGSLEEGFNDIDGELTLSPVPTSDVLNISFDADVSQQVQVTVMDIFGKVLINENRNTEEGENNLKLDVSHLNAGAYFMRLTDIDGDEQTKKFIKM